MIIKKCIKRHLIYNICFIKPLLFKINFHHFFQTLIFLFLRGNQLQPKVVQALAVFQTRLDKAINNLVWPENWSCSKQEGWQQNFFKCLPTWCIHIQSFIQGIVSAFTEKKSWNQIFITVVWVRQLFIESSLSYKVKCDYEEGSALITLSKKSLFTYSTNESVYH